MGRTIKLNTFLPLLFVCAIAATATSPAGAQSAASPAAGSHVPRLVTLTGTLRDHRAAILGVQFALYEGEHGGTPLWLETQNVQVDEDGRYFVLLGGASDGLPLDLFEASEPRWLGVHVQIPGEAEQPRLLIGSVAYALKAADADTIGGRPASDFILARRDVNSSAGTSDNVSKPEGDIPPGAALTGTGCPNMAAKWIDFETIGCAAGNVGIGTTTPAADLEVKGQPNRNAMLRLNAGSSFNDAFTRYSTNNSNGWEVGMPGLHGDTDQGSQPWWLSFLWAYGPFGPNYAKMVLTSNGKLGIGTTSPQSPLHVYQPLSQGNLRVDGLRVSRPAAMGSYGFMAYGNGVTGGGSTAYFGSYYSGGANGRIAFRVDGVNPMDAMVIDENANVGIGTSAPKSKLEVNGGVRLNTATPKPACDATVQGTLWFTNAGVGNKDILQVCAKDASNVYAWRTLY